MELFFAIYLVSVGSVRGLWIEVSVSFVKKWF
jgi:hypothetical protein